MPRSSYRAFEAVNYNVPALSSLFDIEATVSVGTSDVDLVELCIQRFAERGDFVDWDKPRSPSRS